MACGWFIAELDLRGCRVPIVAEFHKWAPRDAAGKDRSGIEINTRASGRRVSQKRAQRSFQSQARTLVFGAVESSLQDRLRSGCGVALEQISNTKKG